MHHPRVKFLPRLAAGGGAAGLGVVAALAASGGLSTAAPAATAASVAHAAHGRTALPALDQTSYRVKAGHRLNVEVLAHAVWKHPRVCELIISRHGHSDSYKVRGVVSNFKVAMTTARTAKGGQWRLSVSCTAHGQRPSGRASAVVLVSSGRHAHGTQLLRKHAHPQIQALQAPSPVQKGKVGLGGAPPNPGFPNGQCTYYAYEMRPDIYWTSVNNGAPRTNWNADNWSGFAAKYGHFAEGTIPQVGAVMVEPASIHSSVGHVAYVTSVSDNSDWVTQEMNTDGRGTPNKVFTVHDNWAGGG